MDTIIKLKNDIPRQELLLKQYIPTTFLFKCWEKDLLLNFRALNQLVKIIHFIVEFPREVIILINILYFELRKEFIMEEINEKNICLCAEEDCLKLWYNPEYHRKFDNFRSALLNPWNIYHCNVHYIQCVHQNNLFPDKCHNVFYEDKKNSYHSGFVCDDCGKMRCLECLDDQHTRRYSKERNICVNCFNSKENDKYQSFSIDSYVDSSDEQ